MNDKDFPYRKDFPNQNKLAYIMQLMGGRGRICITNTNDLYTVAEAY